MTETYWSAKLEFASTTSSPDLNTNEHVQPILIALCVFLFVALALALIIWLVINSIISKY